MVQPCHGAATSRCSHVTVQPRHGAAAARVWGLTWAAGWAARGGSRCPTPGSRRREGSRQGGAPHPSCPAPGSAPRSAGREVGVRASRGSSPCLPATAEPGRDGVNAVAERTGATSRHQAPCTRGLSSGFGGAALKAPHFQVFKARLDGALSTLGWWKVSLPTAGGLEPDDL